MKRKWFIVTSLMVLTLITQAQTVYKVDINEFSRNNMDGGAGAWFHTMEIREEHFPIDIDHG